MAVNDHSRAALRQLLELKCVISRQLPKMPRTYICKILFDGTHESLLAHNHNGQIVGGVCFRCFQGKDFAEVVFLAVDTPYR
jgi:histone acetyltransferase